MTVAFGVWAWWGVKFWVSPLTRVVALTTLSHYRASVWLTKPCGLRTSIRPTLQYMHCTNYRCTHNIRNLHRPIFENNNIIEMYLPTTKAVPDTMTITLEADPLHVKLLLHCAWSASTRFGLETIRLNFITLPISFSRKRLSIHYQTHGSWWA